MTLGPLTPGNLDIRWKWGDALIGLLTFVGMTRLGKWFLHAASSSYEVL